MSNKRKTKKINEAAYDGNLGFMELVKFHSKATPQQKKELSSHIKNKKHKEFRDLIHNVTGVKLHKSVNEEGGAGKEGTTKLVKRYKKDTPGQCPVCLTKFKNYIK